MKSLRESSIFKSNRLKERTSVVGSYSTHEKDIFRDKYWYPHEEMEECVNMYNRHSLTQSALNTMKDFIKGGDVVVKSFDERSRKAVQEYLDNLDIDIWLDEAIENTIKTGNGYAEMDFEDKDWTIPAEIYCIPDSSRIYINCDMYGLPKEEKRVITGENGEPTFIKARNKEEYYIQRVDSAYRIPQAQFYDISYNFGDFWKHFQIYGIPIHKDKIIHFKLNIGDTGVYGRSQLASSLDDYEILKQIERSIAIIAKYKAVPRDIIMYGDKDNPATDQELDDFIIYLESLEKDESAIVNKPIKREPLSYAGQDINLGYMIDHVKKKIIAGLAPDFMMGLGGDAARADAQITLISYILSIYSKRKLFLKPVQRRIVNPFIKKHGLQHCWIEFGELDFETKSEKVNRVGSLWTQNILTLNETRVELGYTKVDDGDKYYTEWQQDMMGDMGGGFGDMGFNAPDQEEANEQDILPNGEPNDQVFNHNPAPKKNDQQRGGPMANEPYQDETDVPKFLQKDQTQPMAKRSSIDNDIKKLDEAITIHIDDEEMNRQQGHRVKEIDFETLMTDFQSVFMEPRQTEVFYKKTDYGYEISFMTKDGIMILCCCKYEDILGYYDVPWDKNIDQETVKGYINAWENQFLRKGIEENGR